MGDHRADHKADHKADIDDLLLESLSLHEKDTEYEQFIRDVGGQITSKSRRHIVFATSASHLLKIMSPYTSYMVPFQRDPDSKRMHELYCNQLDEYKQYGEIGISTSMIALGYCPELVNTATFKGNKYGIGIIDGQHRIGALAMFSTHHPASLKETTVHISLFIASSMDNLRYKFVEINKNYVPVSVYHLEDDIKSITDSVVEWMKREYDSVFFKDGDTTTTNRPFLKSSLIREKMASHPDMKQLLNHHDGAKDHIIANIRNNIIEYNRFLSTQQPFHFSESDRQSELDVCLNAHRKCTGSYKPLFLGMIQNYKWLTEVLKLPKKKIELKRKVMIPEFFPGV